MKLTNIALQFTETRANGGAYVVGECEGAKYHLWLDADTLEPVNDTVFKRPPPGSRTTRVQHLSRTTGIGAKVAKDLLVWAPRLAPNARAAHAQEQARKAAAARDMRADAYARTAGPALLAAARKVLAASGSTLDSLSEALDELQAAVATATPPQSPEAPE